MKIRDSLLMLLSSALLLSGCKQHQHTFSNKWTSDENYHWHESTCEHDVVDAKEVHIDSNNDGKCDVCEKQLQETPIINPSITEISITGATKTLDIDKQIILTANVATLGGASNKVNWSINNLNAKMTNVTSNSVTITGAKEGNVIVTATSEFDKTKTASVEIQILYKGFDPSWVYEEDFAYTKQFPEEQIREFLGEGTYNIISPSAKSDGYYYKVFDSATVPSITIISSGVKYENYAYDLLDSNFSKVYYTTTSGLQAIDPTEKYTISMYSGYDEESGEEISPTFFKFYKCSDYWNISKELTSDVQWNFNRIVNTKNEEIEEAKILLSKIPFIALGKDYQIELVIDYSKYYEIIEFLESFGIILEERTEEEQILLLEAFGYTGPNKYLTIHDNALVEPFENYPNILKNAGYAVHIDDYYGEYYEIPEGLNSYILTYGFDETGNAIYIQQGIATLNEFPTSYANDFIKNVLGSENTIPTYEETPEALFKAQISNQAMEIVVDHVNIMQVNLYANKLKNAGFVVEFSQVSEDDNPFWSATKGKLIIDFYIEQIYDESKDQYLNEGELYFLIYADENKSETQGIYLPETKEVLLSNGSFNLDLEIVKIDNPELIVTSSNPSVATVDGLTVTPISEGETTITVSVVGTEYSASTKIIVIDKTLFDFALAECNEWLSSLEVEEELVLPMPTGGFVQSEEYYYYDGYYECYTIFINTDITANDYCALLETNGFELFEDEIGRYARKGDVLIDPWEYEPGLLEIDIYYEPIA